MTKLNSLSAPQHVLPRSTALLGGLRTWSSARVPYPPEHEDWLPEVIKSQGDKLQGVYNSSDLLRTPKTVRIVGSPLAYGQPRMGVDLGPQCIREGGLHEKLVSSFFLIPLRPQRGTRSRLPSSQLLMCFLSSLACCPA